MEKTVCELFAGVGGFRLGLERASKEWKTVWFSQWEPGKRRQWAHDCYVKHWGDIDGSTGVDIAQVDKERIPAHHLLVGGFPCQDYSVARPLPGSSGIEGKKGVLWWQIRDVLKAKKSPFVLLENVDRLLKSPASQRGRDFGVMLACLADLDYYVEWRVVNAADYQAPQRRRRIFLFAAHRSTKYYKAMAKAKEPIASEGFFAHVFPIGACGEKKTASIGYQDIPAVSEGFSFPFENAGYMRKGEAVTAAVTAQGGPRTPLRSILEQDVPEDYYIARDMEEKWTYLKGAKKVERKSKNGHEYTFSEGPIAFPDDLDLPARTMLTSESSVNRSSHVIRDPQTGRLRLITPLEAERIQGFDDGWTDTGMPERMRYFCMGNALVVPMVTRMANYLSGIFDAE